MFKKGLFLLVTLFSLSTSTISGTVIGNMQATATLNASCSINAQDIVFGAVIPLNNQNTSLTRIIANCTKSTPYSIKINIERDGEEMKMTNTESDDVLEYIVSFSSAQMRSATIQEEESIALIGNGEGQVNELYGRLKENQFVKPGNYKDVLKVSLEY